MPDYDFDTDYKKPQQDPYDVENWPIMSRLI